MVMLREILMTTDSALMPKGYIMPWPADMALPEGAIWLREEVYTAGANGEAIPVWGEITEEARKFMEEMAHGHATDRP